MLDRILALVAPFVLTACALPAFEVQPRYGRLDISGSAGVSSGGTSAAADVEQAGLVEDDSFSARADLKFGMPHLVFLGQSPSFDGTGTLDVTIDDGTNTITAGAAVDSELDLKTYDLALLFDFAPTDTLELALGFGAAYLDVGMRFEEVGTGTVIDEQQQMPIPLVCALASVWIGPVQLSGFLGGMDLSYQGDALTYLDADLYARWKLFGGSELLRASLVLGYRLTDFQFEYEDGSSNVNSDLTIAGPYIGLEASL